MKNKKILSYIFGTMMLLFGIILLFSKDVESIITGISFLFLAILIYPTFYYICILCNKNFSVGRKIALGIGTFLIAPFLFSSEEITYSDISTYIVVVLVFWVIMFATNKKQFIDVEIKQLKKKVIKQTFFISFIIQLLEKEMPKYLPILNTKTK